MIDDPFTNHPKLNKPSLPKQYIWPPDYRADRQLREALTQKPTVYAPSYFEWVAKCK